MCFYIFLILFRAETRDYRIKKYFYGTKIKPLFPFSFEIPFTQISIYKIGATKLPDSCLPLGMKLEDSSTKLEEVEINAALVNHVLAISWADKSDIHAAVTRNIAGFITLTKIDMEKQLVTVLSPQQKSMLTKKPIFLLSNIKYLDCE